MITTSRSLLTVTLLSMAALSGCAIHQKVSPVATLNGEEICVRDNDKVRDGFLSSYRSALEAKGYVVRVISPTAAHDACALTSTYNAHWSWDLATYMAFAEIRVYRNGKPAGEATYDARRGSGSFGKFISADTKIRELVEELFPDPRNAS
ncbi:Sbal_3080 family lipoprotein [Azoarcus taiwanensis]|uniref:Lipoprotein n=1 Tax=Azoarcus taiwanensis TaxID=666964 RepID=A0A972FBP2_9RHOO|nr:Sbal_3080 family lipoprotein [Azoarcus taiwanensis]NMG03749.1 hypothetical protein [Azoarcus taiwanensis]